MSFITHSSHFHLHPRASDLREFRLSFKFPAVAEGGVTVKNKRTRHSKTDVLPQAAMMQEDEKDVVWFKKHFIGRRHITFLASTSSRGSIAISFIRDKRDCTFKFLVRTDEGSERRTVAFSDITDLTLWCYIFGQDPLSVIRRVFPDISVSSLQPCADPFLPGELLAIDEDRIIRNFKFGVGYIPAGRDSESDVLSVETADVSWSFRRFLFWLGEEIQLKGWKGYRGGLDVTNNSTGTKAVYTSFHGNEIIYHVSPFLPSPTQSTKNTYVERKRHLGNDLVLVLFQDRTGAKSFRLNTLGSRQNHVVFLVKEATGGVDGYEISIAMKNGVPSFGPELPNSSTILNRDADGREWFLWKLIQAERAAYRAPVFASKIRRMRGILLDEIAQKFARGGPAKKG